TPVAWDWGRMYRIKNFEQRKNPDGVTKDVTPYQLVDLLNVSGRGVLWMVYMLMNGESDYHYLEGDIKMYVDGDAYPGSPSIWYGGTEDYFLNGSYFNAGLQYTDYFGLTRFNNNGMAGAYHLHVLDPVQFDSSLRITWQNGDNNGLDPTTTGNTYLS